MKKVIVLLASLQILSGCASTKEGTLSGAAIGGATGVVIGNQHKNKKKARLIGGATGAGLGGLIGYLASNDKNKKKQNTKKGVIPKMTPMLTKPKVRMYFEPDKIQGNRYIEGHRVWIIESTPTWTR